MPGYSLIRVWWSRLGRRGAIASVTALILTVFVLLGIPGMGSAIFIRILLSPVVWIAGLTLLMSLLSIIVISRVRVSDLVKRRFA